MKSQNRKWRQTGVFYLLRALPENEISQVPMCYYIKNGILMRKWRPFDVPADDE